MAAPGALTEEDVTAVRAETAAGKSVTVWFTAAAVGVPAGGSAKVLAVGDVADGDFIQVRPGSSKDTMYCSPSELTRTRPPRRRAAETVADQPPLRRSAPRRARAAEPGSAAALSPAASAPPAPRPSVLPPPAQPPGAIPTPAAPPTADPPPRAKASRRRVQRTGEINVSLAATADGEWSVEVLAGTKRVVPRTPVAAAAVAAAARSLPPAVVEVIESSLEGARQRQRDRVEQLRAELDAAQRALDQMEA